MALPETIVEVKITSQSWSKGEIKGEVNAGSYQWHFKWHFPAGKLSITPTLGRSLIKEPLCRFLESHDYQLEAGGDYQFCLRAKL
ncbi:DUF3146 family protein [Cyanobacterium sp. Dongsha4]|uniref:DUF3146 family protein n=1 Tax=Cyanobacterium sp. DS4 TaxID=2878255 RepID=UPI002E808A77|nr:DUF3146 family protein [Cyanobacterium sp. Dongsha4]WVL01169.1 DUF3146 family protein [Cyanobacterium sp. Dongsha4]